MAFNLLQIAKFINGERPSADKFNSIFQFIDSRLKNINATIGSNISDESSDVNVFDEDSQTNIGYSTSKKGFKQSTDNEYLLGASNRYLDIASLSHLIGSVSNLNPLMLNETQLITETIPQGTTEYTTKYPVSYLELFAKLIALNSNSFVRNRNPILNQLLEIDGDFKIGDKSNVEISDVEKLYSDIYWITPLESDVTLSYTINPNKINNSMLSYQGARYNTIPDLNTPSNATSVFVGDVEYFYNLKFSEKDEEGYVTVTLPYSKFVPINTDNQETVELNSGNPTFHNQIKLPEIFEDIKEESQSDSFLIPKGLLYLVHFNSPAEKLFDNDYIYLNETTFKVSGISDDLLNCLLAEPGAENYKQMHVVTIGTDITTSILDIRNKLSNHKHDGSFGDEKIHINDIKGVYEYRSTFNTKVYYPTKLTNHLFTQYLHRDGYRYDSDTQNKDNMLLGDLLINSGGNFSYKLIFGEEVAFNSNSFNGKSFFPGYVLPNTVSSNYNFAWLGLVSNLFDSDKSTFNIQGGAENNLSIISNNDLNLVSKDKIVSVIKDVNSVVESYKVINSEYEFENIKDENSINFQSETVNANINQTQISLLNNNNSIELFDWGNGSPSSIYIKSENKNRSYNDTADQFGYNVGLNCISLISETENDKNELKLFSQDLIKQIYQSKEEYLSDKRDNSEKDFFKKEIPSYYKKYDLTPGYNFNNQNGALENTSIIEVNNSTIKKEGSFVYVVQHLVDDRANPDFKIYFYSLQSTNYNYSVEINAMINKKHIYNKTYDSVRTSKILNKSSIFDTYVNQSPVISYMPDFTGDLMYANINTGRLRYKLIDDSNNEVDEILNLSIGNSYGSYLYNSPFLLVEQNPNYVNLKRFYKHNPFPCSKEYINQHFYLYAYNPGNPCVFRFTSEFAQSNNPYPPDTDSTLNYGSSFNKSRVLTKIVWKKFWLKENINSNSFDYEELLNNDYTAFNNDKYILVNQGYLIDCAIPPSEEHSIEDFNWDLNGDYGDIARDNNYKRVCKFYEVNKDSSFYEDYPNWIAGNEFEIQITKDILTESNLQAISAFISGGLSFTRHGNLQNVNDFDDFFSYFKEHEFEDDNSIIYFGKGFVNFAEIVDEYNNNTKYDIVLDNHYEGNEKQLNRTLNIKLKNDTLSKNYKTKQNIKILFSDFNGENLNLINELLPIEEKIHNSLIYGGNTGPASSVTQYLWKTWRENKEWSDYEDWKEEVFKYSLDQKLYNSSNWIYGVLLNNPISSIAGFSVNLFNELPGNSINIDNLDNSNILSKHLKFTNSYPYSNKKNIFGLNVLTTFNDFTSSVKPRTFFTYINLIFDQEPKDLLYKRKLNNKINLKTNGSNDTFLNSNNLTLLLKNPDEINSLYNYNIGPIQGYYNIEIEKLINRERSYWSTTNNILLNEKFGCSIFDIKVNTDLNFCFIC